MSKKKIIRWLILVAAILILLIVLIVNLGDIKAIWHMLTNANIGYIFLAIGVVLLYAISYQASLIMLTKYRYKKLSVVDAFCISGSEFFFNAITPFSSGGQPFQAYALKRKGMGLSESTSVLLINFISYQICLNSVGLVFIILYYNKTFANIGNYIGFLIAGFTINMIILVLLLLLGLVKPVGNFFMMLFDLTCKIKFIGKRFGNKRERISNYINNMQNAFKDILKSFKIWILAILTKLLSFVFYYSIPFIALLAIGVEINTSNFMYTLALTSFTLTIAIWVPTPGGSGGVETAFKMLYTPFMENFGYTTDEATTISLTIMLVWRFITYYLMIGYGFLLYLIFEKRCGKDEMQFIEPTSTSTQNDENVVLNDENNDIIVKE